MHTFNLAIFGVNFADKLVNIYTNQCRFLNIFLNLIRAEANLRSFLEFGVFRQFFVPKSTIDNDSSSSASFTISV